jgi:phosphatidylglycerophosphate synthase
MVSLLASFVTFGAGFFFLYENPWLFLGGVVMLYLGETLDYVDGTLARTLNKTTKVIWIFLDDLFHEIPRQFVFLFMGIGGFLTTKSSIFLWLGVVALVSQLLIMYLSQYRKALVCNMLGIKFLSEDPAFPLKQENPFLKKDQVFILKILVAPMKQVKLVLLFLAIISFLVPQAMYYSLFFFGPFLFARLILFFINTYTGFINIEKQIKKK